MRPYLALITPLAGGHVDNSLPGVEAPVDPGYGVDVGGRPSHPIARPPFPGRPGHLPARPGRPVDPGYGVEAPAYPDQGLPPYVDNTLPPSPGTPENPIVLPPDGEPGSPTNPIVIPGVPAHPIAGVPGMVVVWIPGRGYVVVQPGKGPDNSLPGGQPPTAQPKR